MNLNSERQFVKVILLFFFLISIISCKNPYFFPITYEVTFDSQDASIESDPGIKKVKYPSTTIDEMPVPPLKSDYSFKGWWTSTNGTTMLHIMEMAIQPVIIPLIPENINLTVQ